MGHPIIEGSERGAARSAMTAVLPVILLLQFPLSGSIWKYAPHLKFLQFPWRWLMALSVIACVLTGTAIRRSRRWTATIAAGAILAMAIGCALLFFQPCDDEDAVAAQIANFRSGDGLSGTDEYTTRGADNASIQQHLPLVRFLRGAQDDTMDSTNGDNPEWHANPAGTLPARIAPQRLTGEHWLVRIAAPQAGFAVLRLMDYPSWLVRVDDRPVSARPVREDGLMAVPMPPGNHVIDVRWTATRDILIGRALSALTVAALVILRIWILVRERAPAGKNRPLRPV